MTRIELTDRAKDDLVNIYSYSVDQWGEKVAQGYIKGLEEALRLLSTNKGLLKRNKNISSRFLIYLYKRHWLICETIGDNIFVLSVMHTATNVMENIRELSPLLEQEVLTVYKQIKHSKKIGWWPII